MRNAKFLTLSCLLTALAAPAASSGEEFLLYAPQPATGDQLPASPNEGVLVKKLTIKRGDTLSQLSRNHIGRASWFPQLLVFNSIKNPDLIYAGDKILVPVTTGQVPSAKRSVKGAKHHAKGTKRAKTKRHHGARRSSLPASPVEPRSSLARPVEQPQPAALQPVRSDEQQSYQHARQAYLAGQYQKAQDLFASFLRKFPNSALAPDASLYQADCFMHLSGQ